MQISSLDKFAQEIESKIVEMIKNGTAPWLKPWDCKNASPRNPTTGTIYSGLNSLNLLATQIAQGYDSQEFLTFNQIKELEGSVKKGEKATKILYRNLLEAKDPPKELDGRYTTIDDKVYRRIFSAYAVFNIDQCEHINKDKLAELREKYGFNNASKQFQNNDILESILQNSGIHIAHSHQDRAYYTPATDSITLPHKEYFDSSEQYYSTALHELGHATGHPNRLDRDLSGKFGTPLYAKEELRAELYSFLQAMELRIDYNLHNHASYVDSWINALERDTKEIGRALKDCVKMVQYVKDNWYPKELHKELANEQKHSQTASNKQEVNKSATKHYNNTTPPRSKGRER